MACWTLRRTTISRRASLSTTSTRRARYGKRFPACRRWGRKEGDVPDQGVRGDFPRRRGFGRRSRRGRGGDQFLRGISAVRGPAGRGADRGSGGGERYRRGRVRQREPGEDRRDMRRSGDPGGAAVGTGARG